MADFSALKTSIQNYIKQNGNNEITGAILQQILLSIVTALGDNAINDLVTAWGDEVTARQHADGTLQDNIDDEASARSQADGTLQQNINSEASARSQADNTLRNSINSIIANIENGYVYAGIATPSTTPASGEVFYLALTAGTYTNFGETIVPQGINILKYNGSAWSLDSFIGLDNAPTQGSNNFVKSGGVLDSIIKDGPAFDLSAYNNGATYADLSAALTALNALPAAYKKGGMSIKFVQSSDNNYIQYFLTKNTWSTNPDNWDSVQVLKEDIWGSLEELNISSNGINVVPNDNGNGWASAGNYNMLFLECVAGATYNITANSTLDAIVMFFRSAPSSKNSPYEPATGYEGPLINFLIATGTTEARTAPSNARYIGIWTLAGVNKTRKPSAIYTGGSDGAKFASGTIFDNKDTNLGANIKTVQDAIVALDSKIEDRPIKTVFYQKGIINLDGSISNNNYHNLYYAVPSNFSKILLNSYNDNDETISIGFYSSTSPSVSTFISGVQCVAANKYVERIADVPNGCQLIILQIPSTAGYSAFTLTTADKTLNSSIENINNNVLRVAAYNSPASSLCCADYVCDGINDEVQLQQALNDIGNQGTIILEDGDYYIDSFPFEPESNNFAALLLQDKGTGNITIQGTFDSQMYYNKAVIYVNETAYNSLSAASNYSIIRHNTINLAAHLTINNITFELYGNQKKIICVDALWSGLITMYGCRGLITSVSYSYRVASWSSTPPSDWENPNVDCVFFRGLSKSQNGNGCISHCCADCFGIAFAVQGEHLMLDNCAGTHCLYGFVFNYYPSIISANAAYCHPMTLINCLEELCLNYPYFGDNDKLQSVNIISFHVEHKPAWFALGGNYATEKVVGSWRGFINYAIQNFGGVYSLRNDPTIKFWEVGNGINMHSTNDAHTELAATSVYKTWAGNYGQKVFDTTLNKLVICTASPSTWVDATGAEIL